MSSAARGRRFEPNGSPGSLTIGAVEIPGDAVLTASLVRLRDRSPSEPLGNAQEADLLARTARGERAAFEALYLAYHRRLARFLMRMTRRHDFAEEVINDTMWIVWRKAGDFRGDSQVSTWIMGIAYRRMLKALRGSRAGSLNLRHEGPELTTEAPQHAAELRDWLERALRQLPLEQRTVLELSYYLGHSCEEVAAIMDCPVNTVKTRMFHARRKLRSSLPRLAGIREGTPP